MRHTISRWVRSTGSVAFRYRASNREDSELPESIFSFMSGSIQPDSVLVLAVVLAFVVPWLLPALWDLVEFGWWRSLLKGSLAARELRDYALEDFELSINQRENDNKFEHTIAFLLALPARLAA